MTTSIDSGMYLCMQAFLMVHVRRFRARFSATDRAALICASDAQTEKRTPPFLWDVKAKIQPIVQITITLIVGTIRKLEF